MSKVKFVGENGKVFFECHPAEVRFAIEAVQDYRLLGAALPAEIRESLKGSGLILKAAPNKDMGDCSLDLITLLSEMFKTVENQDWNPTHIIMSPSTYAHLRRGHADQLDMITNREALKRSIMAKLWTGYIHLNTSIAQGKIIVAAVNGNDVGMTVHANYVEPDAKKELMKCLKEIASLSGKCIRWLVCMKQKNSLIFYIQKV